MSLPATLDTPALPQPAAGASRAARLMHALGPAASGVWAELDPADAERLRRAMTGLDEARQSGLQAQDTAAFVTAFRAPESTTESGSVWQQLDTADPAALARAVQYEHPQLIAVILSRLSPQVSARTVRALPRETATDALKRLMSLGRVSRATLDLLETAMRDLADHLTASRHRDGTEAVARIFDRLDKRLEENFMRSIETEDPDGAARVRALMFTFDDLALLDPAAIQTLLMNIDRADLAIALKGARPAVRDVFLTNMTRRAGELLVSEIEAAGPVRRSEIERARQGLTGLAHSLARRGEILTDDIEDDELVE